MVTKFRAYALALACMFAGQLSANQQCTPKNTEIFFDLHDVVLKKDKKEYFKLICKNLGSLFKGMPKKCRHCNAPLKDQLKALKKRGANGEEYILLLKKHGYNKQAELVRKFSGAYKLDSDVVQIIKDLQKRGYKVSAASNIGTHNLNDLVQPPKHRNKKHRKTRAQISNVLNSLYDIVFVDYETDEIVKKPNREYFEMLRDACGYDAKAIFIDDNKGHVAAANNCGLRGIRFTSAKQLKKDLQRLGVL